MEIMNFIQKLKAIEQSLTQNNHMNCLLFNHLLHPNVTILTDCIKNKESIDADKIQLDIW